MTTSTFVRIVTATSLFLLVSLFGCDREKQRSLIAVWQSTNSTAQAKVDAINKYIARGTDGEFVKHMLGGNTEWIHFHGGSFDTNGKAGLPVDEWLLHFPSADNQIVVLRFHQVQNEAGFRVQFEQAFVGNPLEMRPSIITNSVH